LLKARVRNLQSPILNQPSSIDFGHQRNRCSRKTSPAEAGTPNRRFRESFHAAFFAVHWDHEPRRGQRRAGVSPVQHHFRAGRNLMGAGETRETPALRSGSWRGQTFSCTGDYLFSRSAVVFGSSHVSTPKTHDLYQISPALKPAARGRAHSAKQIHCGRRTGRGIVHGKVVNEILA